MDPLVAVLLGAVLAWTSLTLIELSVDVWFRLARRRRLGEFDADRAEARALLATAHAAQLQIAEILAVARGQVDEIAQLRDSARHSTSTRTSAIPKVSPPRPSPPPPGAPAAY